MCAKTREMTAVEHSSRPPASSPPAEPGGSPTLKPVRLRPWLVAVCGIIGLAVLFGSGGADPLASPSNEERTLESLTPAEGNEEEAVPDVPPDKPLRVPSHSPLPAKEQKSSGDGQPPAPAPPVLAQETGVEVIAYTGEPFGVARITVDFPDDRMPTWYPDQFIQLTGRRVLYPAFKVNYSRSAGEPRSKVDHYECYFLFQGSEPISVELEADTTYPGSVAPADDPKARTALMIAWWRTFKKRSPLFSGQYRRPQVVHDYLTSMLARRLDLSDSQHVESFTAPLVLQLLMKPVVRFLAGPPPQSDQSPGSGNPLVRSQPTGNLVFGFDRFLGLLFGTESIRIAFQLDTTLANADRSEQANLPLPPSMPLPPIRVSGQSHVTPIEAIAHRVPEECFYLRCRNMEGYLWLRTLVMDWGGSFNDLISTEAVDHQLRSKIEQQLAFSPGAAMRDGVDYLISDMALIGTDILFQDGAALGVLFEVKDASAFDDRIRRQREKTLQQVPGTTEENIYFGANQASFLSTRDHRVRSYYATDGKYCLLTTSSHVAKRFFEIEKGRGSLGSLREFQYARTVMPLARNDAVFIYLSDPFFRLIVGPHYRIEMTRRAWAIRDWKQVYLAQMAARAEGAQSERVETLMEAGFLPVDFLKRPDGSKPVIRDGVVYDSLRGALGTFLPIPDVEVPNATHSEVIAYQRFAANYRRQWRRMDPVSIGIRHHSVGKNGRERVTLDVRITPYARENYERLASQLDSPDRLQLSTAPGDLMRVEARLRSVGSYVPGIRARHPRLFAGLRDFPAPSAIHDGQVHTLPLAPLALAGKDYPTYAGAKVPGNPWVDVTGDRHSKPADPDGYSYVDRGFPAILKHRRTWNDHWLAWAQSKHILEEVTPQLQLEPADRSAQVRFRLGDLAASDLGPAIHALCYMHARRISALNVRQMYQMMNQFRLAPDEARRAAEEFLQGQIVCPLKGKYRLEDNGESLRWESTAWQCDSVFSEERVPKEYCHPFLNWLRGAQMELSLDRITLSTHVELEVSASDKSIVQPLAVHTVIPAEHVVVSDDLPSSSSDSSARSPERTDAIAIQGVWKIVKCVEHGKPVPNTEGIVFRIEDNKIIQMMSNTAQHEYEFRLYPQMQPGGFDYLAKGRTIWSKCGLYELNGNRLVICYGHQIDARPLRLAEDRDDVRRWLELERVSTQPGNQDGRLK